jgi:hypothetical protein
MNEAERVMTAEAARIMNEYVPEYTVNVPELSEGEPAITLSLSKLGGGTVGQSYTGTWCYDVTIDGELVTSGNDLESGTAHTHEEMAWLLAEFLADDGSLSAHEDRLYLWATDEDDLEEVEENEPPDTARSEAEYDLP